MCFVYIRQLYFQNISDQTFENSHLTWQKTINAPKNTFLPSFVESEQQFMWACNVIWTFRINPTARKIFVITGQFSSDLVSNEESDVTFIHPLVTWFQVSCLDQSFLDNRGEYSRTSWQIKPRKDLRRVVGNMADKLGHLTIDICYGKGMASKLQNI